VKIHDFGLWFGFWEQKSDTIWEWKRLTTIPFGDFNIFYDGYCLGWVRCYANSRLELTTQNDRLYRILVNESFAMQHHNILTKYFLVRPLTLDDFEIVPNPNNPGAK